MTKRACPCCGCLTLREPDPGSFEICEVCFWEDDKAQYSNPDYRGGANGPSLNEAKKNYLKFGASDQKLIDCVRKPKAEEAPQSNQ
ncbi:MAG: CPCC family cysteine-rich protein [Pseudomonadota bacterium]